MFLRVLRKSCSCSVVGVIVVCVLEADGTATDARPEVPGLERGGDWPRELVAGVDGGEPEAELVGEVVAGAPGAIALDEGGGAEVLQARARAGQGLATALSASRSVLQLEHKVSTDF